MSTSQEKETKKANTETGNEVKEGTAASIKNQSTDTNKYPYKLEQDKQVQGQEEYIDRNGNSKDKS